MSVDSRKKLTAFYDSGKVVVTSEFVNSMFGGLHGTSAGDIIASVDPDDPRIIGHLHDGTHADGRAGKIDLSNHVQGKLGHVNLGDGTVRVNNIQCYPEALKENAIPEFVVDPVTGEKCYYLNIEHTGEGGGDPTDPAGEDTEIQFNDVGSFGTQGGFVFEKEDSDGLRNGKMGINIQRMKQNEPFALSVYGDEQIYSDALLGNEVPIGITGDEAWQFYVWRFMHGGFSEAARVDEKLLKYSATHDAEAQLEQLVFFRDENQAFALEHFEYWDSVMEDRRDEFIAHNGELYPGNTVAEIGPGGDGLYPRYNMGPNIELDSYLVETMLLTDLDPEDFWGSLEVCFDSWIEYNNEVVKFFHINEDNWSYDDAKALYNPFGGGLSFLETKVRWAWLVEYQKAYGLLSRAIAINKRLEERISFIESNSIAYGTAWMCMGTNHPSGDQKPYPSRWYKYSYTISESSGQPNAYIAPGIDFYPWGKLGQGAGGIMGNGVAPNALDGGTALHTATYFDAKCRPLSEDNFLSNIEVPLETSVGEHFVYFRTRKSFDYVTLDEARFAIIVEPTSNNDQLSIESHKLEELLDGDLHVFGLITGGGDKGIRIHQEDSGEGNLRIGINLDKNEMPEAELHIRGESGRCSPMLDGHQSTPLIIEDIPKCDWDFGDPKPDLRGVLLVNEDGHVFVNEGIQCQSVDNIVAAALAAGAGGGLAMAAGWNEGEITFADAAGNLGRNEAVSWNVDENDPVFRLMNMLASDAVGSRESSIVMRGLASDSAEHDLASISASAATPFAVAPNGRLIFSTNDGTALEDVFIIDHNGWVRISNGAGASVSMPARRLHIEHDNAAEPPLRIQTVPEGPGDTLLIDSSGDVWKSASMMHDSSGLVGILGGIVAAPVRRLHIEHDNATEPPLRIETVPTGVGDNLLIDSAGDVWRSSSGARFVTARVDVTLTAGIEEGSPVVINSYSAGLINVVRYGEGSVATASGTDPVFGIATTDANAGDEIIIQTYGVCTNANVRTFGVNPAAAVPPGTPLVAHSATDWAGYTPAITADPIWAAPSMSGSGSIMVPQNVSFIGYLLEEISASDNDNNLPGWEGVGFTDTSSKAIFIQPG